MDKDADTENVDRYFAELTVGVEDGSLFAYDAMITDPQGRNRGVYYAVLNNGWAVIITVPLEDILMGADSALVGVLAAISVTLFFILTALVIRDLKNRKKISADGNTIHILSDSFTRFTGWILMRRPIRPSRYLPTWWIRYLPTESIPCFWTP